MQTTVDMELVGWLVGWSAGWSARLHPPVRTEVESEDGQMGKEPRESTSPAASREEKTARLRIPLPRLTGIERQPVL